MSKINISKDQELIIRQIEELETPMPHDLDDYVNHVLDRLPNKKNRYLRPVRNLAASLLISLAVLSGLIYSNESFAEAVKHIPGINFLVDLLTTDVGSEGAMLNDYPVKETIIIEDGDYSLAIEHMIIDEERITFSTTITGPYFDQGHDVTNDNRDELIDMGIIDLSGKPLVRYDVSIVNMTGVIQSVSYDGLLKQDISINFGDEKGSYISDLIEAQEDLKFSCTVYLDDAMIHAFETFKIPISEEDFLKSKHYPIDYEVVFEEGTLYFDKLIVSPSKMQLIGREVPNQGYERFGLDRIKVSNGDQYEFITPAISKVGGENGSVAYQIIPSVYFEDIREITIGFDNYYYGLADVSFELSLDNNLPRTYDYYGHEFTIDEIRFQNDQLAVFHTIGNSDDFMFNRLDFEGFDIISSSTMISDHDGTRHERYATHISDVGDDRHFIFKPQTPRIIKQEGGEFTIRLE